jgi:Ca-activated chloride channel family protein
MWKKLPFLFIVGIILAIVLFSHSAIVNSFDSAYNKLQQNILPQITYQQDFVTDAIANTYSVTRIPEKLPELEQFPVYSAQPYLNESQVYVEIWSSSEKASSEKQTQGWLVDTAEEFNQKQIEVNGKTIRVGIRNIPSILAAQMIVAGKGKPTGYTPSNNFPLAMLESEGIKTIPVADSLVPNSAGLVLTNSAYRQIAANGEVTFPNVLNEIASGKLKIGYPNPYTSSSGLNLLYSIFGTAAGHPLTSADLESNQVKSVFDRFQQQVHITTTTTLDLLEMFLDDSSELQAFPLEYQNYLELKQIPEFADTRFIPFGIVHNNPLVGFSWNDSETTAALAKFADFARSPARQQEATELGFIATQEFTENKLQPTPAGELIYQVQSFWKQNKDGEQPVFLMAVVDTSGSMEGEPLQAVREGLQMASNQVNRGNYVGLITFGDTPVYRVKLDTWDTLQQQKFLAASERLYANGNTAMYDGMMLGLRELMTQKQAHPNGRFYLLVLTDGNTNQGFQFAEVKDILKYAGVRYYPIAYGDVNRSELNDIAVLGESFVKSGTPQDIQLLLKDIFTIGI